MESVHPFRQVRLANQLTQPEIADRAGVTNQVVLRHEQGIYGSPSPKIISTLAKLDIAPWTEEELSALYRDWQTQHRLYNKTKIEQPILLWQTQPEKTVTMPEFRRLMGQPSVLAICKLLCVHPSQIDRYTRSGGNLFFLEEALRDVLPEEKARWVVTHIRPAYKN